MNATISGLGSGLPSGWLVGGFCWFILRMLGRLDALEEAHRSLRAKLDELVRAVEGDKEKV